MNEVRRVRRRIKKCPNPLFEAWLKEWRDEAKRNQSETQYCFARALNSLRKYPLRFESGKECFILEHFGSKICMMLDNRLKQYNKSTNVSDSSSRTKLPSTNDNIESNRITSNKTQMPVNNYPLKQEKNEDNPVGKRKGCMDSPARIVKNARNAAVSEYIPAYRSGGYAILITLYKNRKKMTKLELQQEAQGLCDASFTKQPYKKSYFTAWSAMSSLIKKGLVEKSGKPVRYYLTESGMQTASKLGSHDNHENNDVNNHSSPCNFMQSSTSFSEDYPNFNLSLTMNSFHENRADSCDIVKNTEENNEEITIVTPPNIENIEKVLIQDNQTQKRNDPVINTDKNSFCLMPNEFDIILCVDTKEIESKQNVDNDKIVLYLQGRNIKFDVRVLNIGDYLWVCRDRNSSRELILPYIIERKRMDDLAQSIKDGRFHEQKFRLKHCKMHTCIYLVEKYGNAATRLGLPLASIQQGISNTKVVDGFQVKVTDNNVESLDYLCRMTKYLIKLFTNKILISCDKKCLPQFDIHSKTISLMQFNEFNSDAGKMKKFTVRNMLIKQLLQLSGLTVEKAKAIVNNYPTAKSLIEALSSEDGEDKIAKITCGPLNRPIGATIVKVIHKLYVSPTLN